MSEPVLVPISHDQFVDDVRTIAAKLASDHWQPDFLIGVGRGGLVPGAYLSHASGMTLLSVDYSSQVFAFADELLRQLANKSIDGKRLLIVDDINDSGSTIAQLRAALKAAGAVESNIRVAVLLNNVRSGATADYWAREIDRATDKSWFVFPWEAMAPTTTLIEDSAAVPERLA